LCSISSWWNLRKLVLILSSPMAGLWRLTGESYPVRPGVHCRQQSLRQAW
jgi:hypothetical protein